MESFIIYSIIFFSFLICGYFAGKKNNNYWKIALFPILIFTLIEGIRYKVGVDWQHYVDLYNYSAKGIDMSVELGFAFLSKIYKNIFGLGYQSIFATMAFLMVLGCWFFGQRNKECLWLSITLFISMFTNTSETLSRQFAALGCCLMVTFYYFERRYLYSLLFLAVAYSFHSSSILIVPVLLLSYLLTISKIDLHFVYFIALLFITFFYDILGYTTDIYSAISLLGAYIGKDNYVDNQALIYGYGFVFEDDQSAFLKSMNFLTTLSIIFYGNKFIKEGNKESAVLYHIVVIGNILMPAFYTQEILKRLLYYFTIFTPFVIAELSWIQYKQNKNTKEMVLFGVIVIYNYYRYFSMAISKADLWNNIF